MHKCLKASVMAVVMTDQPHLAAGWVEAYSITASVVAVKVSKALDSSF